MNKSRKDLERAAIEKYVNAATDLAESVKRNIAKDSKIDNKTVLKLNAFTIAANEISDLLNSAEIDTTKNDTKLN